MIGIIGAGISGLSLGWHLQQLQLPFKIFESTERAGGNIFSELREGFLVEHGPNSLLADGSVQNIVKAIGLEDRILMPEPVSKDRYIFKSGSYRKLPTSPPALLLNGFFSWGTKLNIFREPFHKSNAPQNESVASFFERRFGKEVLEMAVNPFVSGIYAGDPQQLVLHKTFPMLAEFEQNHGSVIKGFIKNSKNSERKASFSFKKGMGELPKAMAQKLPIRFSSSVTSVEQVGSGFEVRFGERKEHCSALVMTAPAHATGRLLANMQPDFGAQLQAVNYPPMVVVHSGFNREAVGHPLNGFGGLNPKKEGQFAAGSIWSSSLFPNRCPEGKVLITTFVGGEQYRDRLALSDADIKQKVTAELQQVYQITEGPVYQDTIRWEKAIPQYDRAVLGLTEKAEALKQQGLFFCTNWMGGVSVADCLKKGQQLAQELKERMG